MLDYMCTDVTEVISANFHLATHFIESIEETRNLVPLLESAGRDPESLHMVIEASAICDILFVVTKSIFSDNKIRDQELEAAAELLSESMHRYCWLSDYTDYLFLSDGDDFRSFILKWWEDTSPLGGHLTADPITRPFQSFAILACSISKSTSLYKMYAQSLKLIAKFIIKSDGVRPSERKYYTELRETLDRSLSILKNNLHTDIDDETVPPDNEPLRIEQSSPLTPDDALKQGRMELNSLIGVRSVKAEIERLSNFLNIRAQRLAAGFKVPQISLHFVFTGNPGTGKTSVARIIGKLLYGFGIVKSSKFIEADRSTLVGGYVGQTALKTSEVISNATDGVLFIDEAYALSKQTGGDYGHEAIDTLLKKMEDLRDRLVVIVAGYPALMAEFINSNPGLKSRFTRFIDFEDHHVADLLRIFEGMCEAHGYKLSQQARGNLAIIFNRAYVEREANFGNGRWVRNAYEITLSNHSDRLVSLDQITRHQLQTIEASDLPFSMAIGHGVVSPFDLSDSCWEVQCPRCLVVSRARLEHIGRLVNCKCGLRFKCPWWNLDRRTVPGLVLFEKSNRDTDLLGYDYDQ
jgi:hypothetical protein